MTSLLQSEIASQPEVIARLVDDDAGGVTRLLAGVGDFDTVVVTGRGSSHHAGIYLQYVLGALTGIPVVFAPPSLQTLYGAAPRWQRALVVAVSQGGGSPDTVQVAQAARRLGRPTIAVTNDTASPLAAAADHVIGLGAGEERSLAATKTYTAQLTVMALIAAALSGEAGLRRDLDRLPAQVSAQLALAAAAHELAAGFVDVGSWTLLARGYNLASAREGALKLTELTYAPAIGYSAADYLHGPIAAADDRTHAIIVAADDPPTRASLQQVTAELAARGVHLTAVSAAPLDGAHAHLPLTPDLPAWLSPICSAVPLQHLAMALASAKGHDLDHPRGLRKITRTT